MKAIRKTADTVHGHGHRHSPPGQHEHEHEPQYGLPEALPEGEQVLWQGAPDWKLLAVKRFHVRKVAVYFAILLAARVAALMSDGMPLAAALSGTLVLGSLAVVALGLLSYLAWYTARTTAYTLTNKRVVMRIGIALTISLNLPLKRVESAALADFGGGRGDIAIKLLPGDRVAYLHLWPHARRWHFTRTEPTLLCLPDAAAVAQRLTEAWAGVNGQPARAAAAAGPATPLQPTLATR
jgi:Bacterial PH domain